MLIEKLRNYRPKNDQEAVDKTTILEFLTHHSNAFSRENRFGHITSSAIIVNPAMTKVVFAYHKIYDAWGWVGGHNDGNPNTLEVALKETKEETNLKHVYPYSEDIFMIDVIYVAAHYKSGEYIGDHLHLNLTYLLIAPDHQPLDYNPKEHKGIQWFDIETVLDFVDEPRMIPVYTKAFNAIKAIKSANNLDK